MTYAVIWQSYGWAVLQVEDGTATPVCSVGNDRDLAVQVRDYLANQERIDQLLARHGLVDCPLEQVTAAAPEAEV